MAPQYNKKSVRFTQGLDFVRENRGKTGRHRKKSGEIQEIQALISYYNSFKTIFFCHIFAKFLGVLGRFGGGFWTFWGVFLGYVRGKFGEYLED